MFLSQIILPEHVFVTNRSICTDFLGFVLAARTIVLVVTKPGLPNTVRTSRTQKLILRTSWSPTWIIVFVVIIRVFRDI